jgi:hypothetical protein
MVMRDAQSSGVVVEEGMVEANVGRQADHGARRQLAHR